MKLSQAFNEMDKEKNICIEVWNRKFVGIIWHDPENGLIMNARFGSGRHHTAVGLEIEKALEQIKFNARESKDYGATLVKKDGKEELQVIE